MEEKNEEPVVDNTVGKLKVKKKMKKIKSNPEGDTATVDLKKPIEPKQDETKEDNTIDEGVVRVDESTDAIQESEEVQPEAEVQERPVLEEITSEEVEEVAEQVEEAVKSAGGDGPLRIEGLEDSLWVLLDFGPFVVHVFHEETRAFYDIERLWSDVQRFNFVESQAD